MFYMVFFNERHRYKGFSFPEILMALLIIVAMSTGAIFASSHMMDSGRYNATKSSVSAAALAVSQYKFEVGSYPLSLDALTVKNGTYGPWIQASALKDTWNNDLLYFCDGDQFAVWSAGANTRSESRTPLTAFGGDDIGIVAR